MSLLVNNTNKCEFYDFDKLIDGIVLGHLHFPNYEKVFNYKNILKFAIIRDPVKRFISTFSASSENNNLDIFNNQTSFDTFINKWRNEGGNNWFTPQVNFLDHKTKLWKYEDGFDKKFFQWLKNYFNIHINKTKNLKKVFNNMSYDNKKLITLTNKQKNLIHNYYYQDYQVLKYELI
tara:strand:+ start:101 stop:631 length:531 start_codon:yes stop_codon:yes gene_type:complete